MQLIPSNVRLTSDPPASPALLPSAVSPAQAQAACRGLRPASAPLGQRPHYSVLARFLGAACSACLSVSPLPILLSLCPLSLLLPRHRCRIYAAISDASKHRHSGTVLLQILPPIFIFPVAFCRNSRTITHPRGVKGAGFYIIKC